MDLHFLYVIIPLSTEPVDNIQNVIAAVSQDEYENLADELVHLNQLTGDAYSPATAKKYLDAYNSGKLSFFEEITQWGDDYTGLLPLYDSAGQRYAALCMDVDILEIHSALRLHTATTAVITVLLGLLFMAAFILWTGANITRPIQALESTVVSFAQRSHGQKDPDALLLNLPELHTDNEVASLAQAVVKMSEDMRDYVNGILSAEQRAASAERAAADMTSIAYQDALTGVKNKAAYAEKVRELEGDIAAGRARFALVMIDLNHLKRINDSCGHENGDRYIVGACGLLCRIFKHSPVFRFGGDEFIVVLQGDDYASRDALFRNLSDAFDATLRVKNAPAWQRFSVARGMAEYTGADGETVEQVFNRADSAMYHNKAWMKRNNL